MDEEKVLDVDLSVDATYLRPLIINKFKELVIRRTRYPIFGIDWATNLAYTLLIMLRLILDTFRRALSEAYSLDYSMPNIVVFLPSIANYSEKASFSNE